MAKGDINIKLVLQGEKEYSQGMKNAAANVKELNSRLKAAQAEFENAGDAQKYAAEQAEIFKQKIEEQEKAVKAAEDALKYLSDNGFEENDARMRSWRISLNNAKAELNKLQAQLKKTESATDASTSSVQMQAKKMSEAETAAKGYADKLDKIDKNISFETALSKLNIVKDTVSAILEGVEKVGKGIWNYEAQAAQWATEINTKAAEAGISPAVYQSYQYAAMMLGMTIDDYVEMSKEIDKALMSEDVEIAKAFNELGVETRNQDGTMRSAFEVLNEVAAALGSVNTETAKNVLASKLLGEEYRKLNPLINAGGDAWAHYVEEGKDIGTVSKSAFDALTELDKSRLRLATQFDTIKRESAGQLAPGFQAITDGLSGLLTQFDEFLDSEKGQAVVEKINGLLTTIGETIGNIDVGNAVDGFFSKFENVDLGKTIDTIAKAVSSFTDALSWVIEHGEDVVSWIGKIAAAYGAIKVSSEVIQLMNFLKSGSGGGGQLPTVASKAASAATGVGLVLGIRENAGELVEGFNDVAEGIGLKGVVDAFNAGAAKIWGEGNYVAVNNALADLYGDESLKIDKAPTEPTNEMIELVEALEDKLTPDWEKYMPKNDAPPTKGTQQEKGEVTEIKFTGSFNPFKPSTGVVIYDPAEEKRKEEERKREEEEAKRRHEESLPLLAQGLAEMEQARMEAEADAIFEEVAKDMTDAWLKESGFMDEYLASIQAEIEAAEKGIEEAKETAIIEPLSNLDAAVEAAATAGEKTAEAYAEGLASRLWLIRSMTERMAIMSRLPILSPQSGMTRVGSGTGFGNVYIDGTLAGYTTAPTVNTYLGMEMLLR